MPRISSIFLPPVAVLLMAALGFSAQAAPYIPKSGEQVLERLPLRPNDPVARELLQLRNQLRADPRNVVVATALARRYYDMVAEEGDPRYLGYAQAALAPWWELPEPPVEVQVLRAGLAQFSHNFSGALTDLSSVLARDPRNAQARVLRATIHIVQARYGEAGADCAALRDVTSELIATGCSAMVDGLTGKLDAAHQRLADTLAAHPDAPAGERLWVLIRLAEMAQRQERALQAEAYFRQAVGLGITDTFLLAAYADYLLDHKRYGEVVTMLKDKTPSDGLLLRLVLAETEMKLPSATDRAATLAARYHAAQLRGDTVHQQEEARFRLEVHDDAKNALPLAQENWKVQKEPRDARILLASALAAKAPAAAAPVFRWLKESRIEDKRLQDLAARLREVRK
jgi:tetratricopeptide (TPR) repeat protein